MYEEFYDFEPFLVKARTAFNERDTKKELSKLKRALQRQLRKDEKAALREDVS